MRSVSSFFYSSSLTSFNKLDTFLYTKKVIIDTKTDKIELNGSAANNTYIITPYNVDISGDLIDELENTGMYFGN